MSAVYIALFTVHGMLIITAPRAQFVLLLSFRCAGFEGKDVCDATRPAGVGWPRWLACSSCCKRVGHGSGISPIAFDHLHRRRG